MSQYSHRFYLKENPLVLHSVLIECDYKSTPLLLVTEARKVYQIQYRCPNEIEISNPFQSEPYESCNI